MGIGIENYRCRIGTFMPNSHVHRGHTKGYTKYNHEGRSKSTDCDIHARTFACLTILLLVTAGTWGLLWMGNRVTSEIEIYCNYHTPSADTPTTEPNSVNLKWILSKFGLLNTWTLENKCTKFYSF